MRFYSNKEDCKHMIFDDGTKMFYYNEMSQGDDEYVHGPNKMLDTEKLISKMVDRFETEDGNKIEMDLTDCKNWEKGLYNQIVEELVAHYYPKVWKLLKSKSI